MTRHFLAPGRLIDQVTVSAGLGARVLANDPPRLTIDAVPYLVRRAVRDPHSGEITLDLAAAPDTSFDMMPAG